MAGLRFICELNSIREEARARIALRKLFLAMRIPLIGLLLGLVSIVSALSAAGSKVLVVLEEESERSKYSQFVQDLQGMGHWTSI